MISRKVSAIREMARAQRAEADVERRDLLTGLPEDQEIVVRRQWDGALGASYRLRDVEGLHLSDTSGGIGRRANRLYAHGYVSCEGMLDGDLDHSCAHGPPPHRIKVCVVGKDNGGSRSKLMLTVKRLAELGGPRPLR